MKIDDSRDCVQIAYNIVREEQGLDPRPIPEGYVIITRETIEESDPDEQEPEN